ncbi:MAG: hypothetical protein RLN75_08970 [Longimicrobiales bacterium]
MSDEDRSSPGGSDFIVTLVHAEVSRVDESGTTRLLRIPYLQSGVAVRDGAQMVTTLPFPHRGRTALSSEGLAVVFSGEPEVLQYDRTGALLRRMRFPAFDLTLDEAVVDSTRQAALAEAATPELREIIQTSYSLPAPERRPTFEEVRADGDHLVLGLHRVWTSGGRKPWLFVSPGERRAGVLRLAEGERILDVEGDRVLVAGTTPAGVPQVTLLEIEDWT